MRPFLRLTRIAIVVVMVLSLALAAGCSSKDDSKALETTVWQADMIRMPRGLVPAVSKNVTAEFKGGTVSGNGGVNQYHATYTTAGGNKITIDQAAATLMAGPPAAMEQEQAYFENLSKAARYVVTADSLTLQDDQAKVLVSYTPMKSVTLTGTQWECNWYNNGKGALVTVISTSTITAVFSEDKKLSGNGGVNTYNTTYSADKGEIKIDPAIATTQMAGPQDVMDQEAAYLAALPKATRYKIVGDTLELRDAGGAAMATYIAK